MNRQRMIRFALLAAIGIASIAIVAPGLARAARSWFSGPETGIAVPVASRYIPAHSPVSKRQMRVLRFPRALVPPGALDPEASWEDAQKRPTYSAAVAIPEGQPITRALLVDSSSGDSLAHFLRPGQMAVSFEVERAKGVGGWLRPGDTVALFTGSRTGMRLLIPSITLLAVDNKRLASAAEQASPSSEEKTPEWMTATSARLIVTVRANAAEAARLVEAGERESLHAVLRSVGDDFPWLTEN